MKNEPSPEVKAILKSFVAVQKEKYGDDWKKKLASEMAAKTAPVVHALLSMRKK